jgi:hypothetical protein
MRAVLSGVDDPALEQSFKAHAERLGIWVAIWPVTLLVLSFIVARECRDKGGIAYKELRALLNEHHAFGLSIGQLSPCYGPATMETRRQTLIPVILRTC